MKTKASLLHLPLHPLLVVVPLGALPTVLVFDVLFVAYADAAWYRAAFVASLVGAILLFAAMVPGFTDYFANVPRRGEVWKHAAVHAVFGVAVVGYFIATAAARAATLGEPTRATGWAALIASGIGNIALFVQAVIGRGLVLRHFLGVEEKRVAEIPPSAGGARPRGPVASRSGRMP